jgi:hypothetical protein
LRLRPCLRARGTARGRAAARIAWLRLLALIAISAWGTPALAADPNSADPGGPGLDQLLKLPTSVEYSTEKKGGATRSEWRQRFHDARTSVTNAEKALKKAQDELAEVAGSKDDWQFTPPGLPEGANDADSTTSYKLRQEVKRQRSEVERSKARLRELEVAANLGGVPEDWRDPSTEARSGDGSVTEPPTTP